MGDQHPHRNPDDRREHRIEESLENHHQGHPRALVTQRAHRRQLDLPFLRQHFKGVRDQEDSGQDRKGAQTQKNQAEIAFIGDIDKLFLGGIQFEGRR